MVLFKVSPSCLLRRFFLPGVTSDLLTRNVNRYPDFCKSAMWQLLLLKLLYLLKWKRGKTFLIFKQPKSLVNILPTQLESQQEWHCDKLAGSEPAAKQSRGRARSAETDQHLALCKLEAKQCGDYPVKDNMSIYLSHCEISDISF